jgi:LysR family nitrogen assimilation transcriptional regulator
LNTDLLNSFVKVVEHGSFSVAAIHLSKTQSTLSKHILALEQEMGLRLFYRDGRGVSVTEDGQRLYTRALRIINEIEQARLEASESSENPVKSLVIALPPTLARVVALPFTRRVLEELPNTKLRFVEGFSNNILEWLKAETIDVAVLYDSSATFRLNAETLLHEELWFISSPKQFPRIPAELRFSDLVTYPLILPGSSNGLRALINRCCETAQTEFTTHIEAESLSIIVDLVVEGYGCTILPISAIKGDIEQGRLKASRIREPYVKRTLVLSVQESRIPKSAMQKIVSLLRDTIHELNAFEK